MFKVVDEHNSLISFYRQNGLEVSDDISAQDGAVFSIAAICENKILAAATLSRRFNIYILDYIAVDKSQRRKGLGLKALTLISEKAKQIGADRLYITARNPDFFRSAGFNEGQPDGVDMNADCEGCPQFLNGCVKLPMYLNLY